MSSIVIQGDTSGSITVEAPSVAGTHTLTLPKATGNIATDATVGLGTKNLIINGDMRIAQRGTSSTSLGYYTVDRYYNNAVSTDQLAITQSQSTDTPSTEGFSNSFKNEATTAESAIDADDLFNFANYTIEAQDCQHLKYGTANAVTTTLSFWVKSSVTGTYVVGLYIADSSRLRTFTYTISSANTWEKKTITITGDTVGSINNDNGAGIRLIWVGFAGSNWNSTDSSNWINYASTGWAYGHTATWGASTSDTFYLTGVQLEVGENATPFEYRMYSQELAMCQRYYKKYQGTISGLIASCYDTSYAYARLQTDAWNNMRTTPTYSMNTSTSNWDFYSAGANRTLTSVSINIAQQGNIQLRFLSSGGFSSGSAAHIDSGSPNLQFNAEL